MPEGYSNLGEAKFTLFRNFSVVWIPAGFLCFFMHVLITRDKMHWKRNLPLFFCILSLVLSYLFSVNKEEALWGTNGWRMGFLTLLICYAASFLFAECGKKTLFSQGFIETAIFAVPFIVIVNALCNTFSVYPVQWLIQAGFYPEGMITDASGFVTTIGNLDWYCGYLSVFLPVAAGLFAVGSQNGRKGNGKQRGVLNRLREIGFGIFLFAAFMSAALQGAGSILLAMGVLCAGLFLISLSDLFLFRRFLLVGMIGSAALLCARVLYTVFGKRYYYDSVGNQGLLLIQNNIIPIIFIVFLLVYLFFQKKEGTKKKGIWYPEKTGKGFLFLLPVLFLLFGIGSLYLQTHLPSSMSETFGNGRGKTWAIGGEIFASLDTTHKLFGVGEDAFSAYAQSVPQIAEEISDFFSGQRLTNAHSELLTMLVQQGIFGVGAYLLFLTTCLWRFVSHYEQKENAGSRAVSLSGILLILSYTANGLVSFGQITSTSYFLVLLGLCLSLEF